MALAETLLVLLQLLSQSFIYNIFCGVSLSFCMKMTWKEDESYKQTANRAIGNITDLVGRIKFIFKKPRENWKVLISALSISALNVLGYIYFMDNLSSETYYGVKIELLKVNLISSPLNYVWLFSLFTHSLDEGSLASGLAWGYYFGYLECTAPYLKDFIQNSTCEENLKSIPKRFILIPENGKVPRTLEATDERIQFVENTCSCKIDNAGIKQRQYFQSIYRFSPRSSEFSEFYCIVEHSASVRTFKLLQEQGVISSNMLKNVVKMFYQMIDKMVKSKEDTRGKYEIILYSGNDEDIVDAILSRRRELLN